MAKSERSTVSEVYELLREFGPDAEITVKDISARMPWVASNHASAALGLLSQERYGALIRLGKEGRIRRYRITDKIYADRREHKKPAYAKRYGRQYGKRTEAVRPLPTMKGSVSDALLDAAMIADSGGPEDSVMDIIRGVYLHLRKARQGEEEPQS